jgi:hypothetical protein
MAIPFPNPPKTPKTMATPKDAETALERTLNVRYAAQLESGTTVRWDELTAEERETLIDLERGNEPLIAVEVVNRLIEMDLAVGKLGGTRISERGRKLVRQRDQK